MKLYLKLIFLFLIFYPIITKSESKNPSTTEKIDINPSKLLENKRTYDLIKNKTNLKNDTHNLTPRYNFENMKNGYYYTTNLIQFVEYTSNYDENKLDANALINENIVEIKLEDKYNNESLKIGKKGTLVFVTSYDDSQNIFNISDIEEKTSFDTNIIDEDNNSYDVNCKLWKPNFDNIHLLCDLKEILIKNNTKIINFINTELAYEDNIIRIVSYLNPINIQQYNKEIPFLYSDKQTINIIDDIDYYEIKFKISKYNNELLFITGEDISMIPLDNNTIKGKELICSIKKEKLEESIQKEEQLYMIKVYKELIGFINFKAMLGIVVEKKITEKENIYINITNLLEKSASLYEYIAYETNITILPNIFTREYDLHLEENNFKIYFKKSEGKPLLLLILADKLGNYSIGNIKENIILNQIHLMYNFIITPVNLQDVYEIKEEGSNILTIYPEILDFRKNDILILNIFLNNPDTYKNIKINPEAENDLECTKDISLLRCIIPKNHFERKSSGYHHTYHLNYLNKYIPFYFFSPIKVILPIENELILRIGKFSNMDEKIIGESGIISFGTEFKDNLNIFNISEIEEISKFEVKLKNNLYNEYNVSCRLWKQIDGYIRIFCDFDTYLTKKSGNIYFLDVTFEYNHQYNITIIQTYENILVVPVKGIVPFLYSDRQEINIENNIELYEIKFKLGIYNNELLNIFSAQNNQMMIDDCSKKGKELICTLKKNDLLEMLGKNNKYYSVAYIYDYLGYFEFNDVGSIKIFYKNVIKEDIKVEITNLKENSTEMFYYIVYDTNISSLDNIVSNTFQMNFTGLGSSSCFFKKAINTNLSMLCDMDEHYGIFKLEQNNQEIELDDIHYKYNFKIQPIKSNETFKVLFAKGFKIMYNYPKILNYSIKDSLDIILIFAGNNLPFSILKLNPNGSSLNCESHYFMAKCHVPKSHFDETNIYNLMHGNIQGGLSLFYELNPFDVFITETIEILIEKEDNIINLGKNGIISFKTNYYDIKNIFEQSEIETFNFQANFTDLNNNDYEAKCNFWKPGDENMLIFCKLKENLEIGLHNIKLKDIKFFHKNNYTIYITSLMDNIKVNQLDSNISFLYSDKQELIIRKDDYKLNLTFKYLSYDENPLYLYKNDIKSIKLDNCYIINKEEIECSLNKEKFLEILSYTGENYYLGEKLDNNVLNIFNSVLNITFNYQIVQEEKRVKIGKLLTPFVSRNEFFAYETNIENIATLISDYFNIYSKSNDNEVINCIFKKNINFDKLLLLCNDTTHGLMSLGNIKSKNLDKINILYKFILEEFTNDEILLISNIGTKITSVYPLEIQFKSNESYKLIYETEKPELLEGIKLNNDYSYELNCINKNWYKECIVNKTHFTKNGFYFTYHTNHQGKKSIYYEIPQIKIIVEEKEPESDNNHNEKKNYGLIIGLPVAGGVILILVIIFLVWHYLKKKKANEIDSSLRKSGEELNSPMLM